MYTPFHRPLTVTTWLSDSMFFLDDRPRPLIVGHARDEHERPNLFGLRNSGRNVTGFSSRHCHPQCWSPKRTRFIAVSRSFLVCRQPFTVSRLSGKISLKKFNFKPPKMCSTSDRESFSAGAKSRSPRSSKFQRSEHGVEGTRYVFTIRGKDDLLNRLRVHGEERTSASRARSVWFAMGLLLASAPLAFRFVRTQARFIMPRRLRTVTSIRDPSSSTIDE